MPVGIALATGSTDKDPLVTVLAVFVFASLVALPVLLVVAFFVSVLVQHAFIRFVAGRDHEGLRATARVSCYAVGDPVAVAWVPLVGFLAVFYCFYLHTTGLRRVHRISTGRSLGAVLILVALSLVLATGVTLYEYSVIREAIERPVSRYLPGPEGP